MAAKKPKTIKHNTTTKDPAKIFFPEYTDMLTMRQKPVSLAFLENLAAEMVNWVNSKSEKLVFTQFLAEKGMSYSIFRQWKERCPKLVVAHEYVLETLGAIRESGALKRKLDSAMVLKSMPVYSYDWAQLEKERDERKAKRDDKNIGNITVVMERFGNDKKDNNS